MKKYLFISLMTVLASCSRNNDSYRGLPFKTPANLEHTVILPVDSSMTIIIKPTKPEGTINASDFVEDFKYIPLETTSEALIAYYTNLQILNNRIYIVDNISANALFIYDINGKFLKKIGNKGGGPQDFGQTSGFAISIYNNYIVIYDNWKRRMMYFDMDGNFLKATPVLYRQFATLAFVSSNSIATITGKNVYNKHLGILDNYRLLFTDTLGNIQKAGLEFDDNCNLAYEWSWIRPANNDILYYQQFANSIYSVSDTLIREKYRINCSAFNQFNIKRLTEYQNDKEFQNAWNEKSNLLSYIAETDDYLYFVVNNKKVDYLYFYNKRNGKLITFDSFRFDTDFYFSIWKKKMFVYGDYFVATASTVELANFKKQRLNIGIPLSEHIAQFIDGLEEDDNDVLVLFKLKNL